jgi:DNA-binding response OmpR family regulator
MKQKILVIDDEEEYRTFLREVLRDDGYTVMVAPDGTTGLACTSREHFDLIVTDMIMPDLHGPELIAKLRLAGCVTPIIAISGNPAGDASLAVAEAYSANGVLTKPFKVNELRAMVKGLLQTRKTRRTMAS